MDKIMKCLIVDDIEGWRLYNQQRVTELLGQDVKFVLANSAKDAYDKLFEHNNNPFDLIITDLQMEDFYAPKYAGEWLVEQIKTLRNYYKTKIVIVSGTYNIKQIADEYGVYFIPKSTAYNFPESYKPILLEDNKNE